jgi:hypothetical protein
VNGWLRPAIAAALAIGSPIGMTVPAGAQPANREALAAALQTLAEEGEAEASYHLGMMRLLGIGGPKDAKAAFDLFRNAAEKGNPLGAYKLGDFYARADNGVVPPDRAEALRLKTIAAEAGYALAQHDVARLHFEAGEMDLALEWLTRAAQQGQADALRALASLHNSDAIPKDGARTFAYYSLFLKRIAAPTEAQRAFLERFSATLSAEDRARGERILADWKTEPTELTRKAQAGLRAAEALVSRKNAESRLPEPDQKEAIE